MTDLAPVAPLAPLVREWLADLQIQGRSSQTIDWCRRRMDRYLGRGGVRMLDRLTGSELKRYLADLQGRGLSAENRTRLLRDDQGLRWLGRQREL